MGGRGEWLPPADPKVMRERLVRWLEGVRRLEARLDRAIADLDKGADPARIRRDLEGDIRAGQAALMAMLPPDELAAPGEREREGGSARRMTADERERVRELIRGARPDILAKLEKLAGEDRELADRVLQGLGGRIRGLIEAHDRDPEMFAFRLEELDGLLGVMAVTREARQAERDGVSEAARAQIHERLRAAMAAQFDVRLRLQERQLADIRRRAEMMERETERLRASKDRVVEEKTRDALRGGGPRPEQRRPEPAGAPADPR